MAIAELTREQADLVTGEEAGEGAGRVRVAVHDASRIEWNLTIPLPEKEPAAYSLRVDLEFASNAFVRHSPWDQMQAFARLDGPAITAHGDAVTIDHLRRGALAMASQLARAHDGFQRHCRLAASLFATAPHRELEDVLLIWIEASVRIAQDARERLVAPADIEPAELTCERNLVDEYISVRLLEMLAGCGRALSSVAQSRSPNTERLRPVIALVESRLAEVLSGELVYRKGHGFANADPSSPAALERYLDRASRLKKHFQEVLFLDPETFQVAERAYHWIAAFFAVVASTWAFAWQLALMERATNSTNTATTVSSGVVVLCVLAGLGYAAKDRIKEIGRNWMTRRVHRVWGAQRITRYRAPERRVPGRDVVATARESWQEGQKSLPDSLNPECGATRTVTVLTYQHRGEIVPNQDLLASGVRRVKHVFRYDLSPMFARLDDATKPVPFLDEVEKRVRFIDAPRCYRVPIQVELTFGGRTQIESATLVVHKRGLERVERDDESDPNLAEIGLEPG